MPFNKSQTTHEQQSFSRMKSEAITLKMNKFAKRPPSLNKINKNLP
ncbi:hypothetical protein [Paenibacillus nanensis]|nr:hypothetical protein [Paenibacillus nanensis]